MAETHKSPMTFLAEEALTQYTRVKQGTLGTQVVYADAGEVAMGVTLKAAAADDPVPIHLTNAAGTVKVVGNDTFAAAAVLYGHDAGQVSDSASGAAIGIALESCTAAGDIIEMVPWNILPTTGAITIADAGSIITATDVEDTIAEFATHWLTAQQVLPMPLADWRAVDTNAIADVTDTPATDDDYGSLLHIGSTPILNLTNGDTDSCLDLEWVATDVTPIIFQTTLPPRFDVASDLVIHIRAKMGGATDAPQIASDVYFNEGDTKVEDLSATGVGAAFAEETITIAAADIPAGAQSITIELTPAAHGTDALYVTAIWGEYTNTLLTS